MSQGPVRLRPEPIHSATARKVSTPDMDPGHPRETEHGSAGAASVHMQPGSDPSSTVGDPHLCRAPGGPALLMALVFLWLRSAYFLLQ